MKLLTAVFAAMAFSMVAMACDEQGSAEDCPGFHDEPPHVTFCTPDGICCDFNGCSGTWVSTLPLPVVPLPSPDYILPEEQKLSN